MVEPPLERMSLLGQLHGDTHHRFLVLSRIQAFLPELAASNADLLRRAREDPSSVDIENVGAEEGRYIEMVRSALLHPQHPRVSPSVQITHLVHRAHPPYPCVALP